MNPTTEDLAPRGQVGVLLVHGIGDHEEGATLTSFGEPLLDWLRAWLWAGSVDQVTSADGKPLERRGDVRVDKARLHAARTEAESPAYALATISAGLRADGHPDSESWLFCEAWWGASVLPPPSFMLLRWLFARGPMLIYWHFFHGKEVPVRRAIAAISLAGLSQAVIAIAMALWFVPIERWRRAVVSAAGALTLTLGDSYVLLEQEIQRAALVERVKQSLLWLAARTEQVIVVAHSQGAALADEALRAAGSDRVRLLITVGSGLEKLQFLRAARYQRAGTVSAPLAFPFLSAALLVLLWGVIPPRSPALIVAGVFLLLPALGAFIDLREKFDRYRAHFGTYFVPPAGLSSKNWLDLYASHDLVAAGSNSLLAQGYQMREEVYNERSLLRDHTSYFDNRVDFLPRVWRAMARVSRLPLMQEEELPPLTHHVRLHRERTLVLWLLRFVTASALLLFICFRADIVVTLGNDVRAALESASLSDILKPFLWVAGAFSRIIASLVPASVEAHYSVGAWLLGSIALVVPIALWWVAIRGIWRALCLAQWRKLCARRDVLPSRPARILRWLEHLLFFAMGSLPLVAAIITAFREETLTVQLLSQALSAGVGGFVLLLCVLGAGTTPWAAEHEVGLARRKAGSRRQRIFRTAVEILKAPVLGAVWFAAMGWLALWIYPPFRAMRGLIPLGVALVLVMWLSFLIHRIHRWAKRRTRTATAAPAQSAS